MSFFEDWNKIMGSANDDVVDWVKTKVSEHIERFLNDKATKRDLETLIDECNKSLQDEYEQETYYDFLERYVHNGRFRHDIGDGFITSAFYSTLISVFVYFDSRYRGEENFTDYHLYKMQKLFPNVKFDKNDVKMFFLDCYNAFEKKFATPSSEDRAIVNAVNEATANEAYNTRQAIHDESQRTQNAIKELRECLDKMHNQDNEEKNREVVVQMPSEMKILDDNGEYQKIYQDTLFLEKMLNDDKKATLKDTYVEPCVKYGTLNRNWRNFDFEKWLQDEDSRVLLLYGKAGIGKTSFVARLASNNSLDPKYHILKLRKYTGKLNSNASWKSIKECFECEDDNAYRDSILILDGLDEVCVLNCKFDGLKFVNNLRQTLEADFGRSIRVIITSRMGYFDEIKLNKYTEIAIVQWDEGSVNEWCNSYCRIHENRTKWCDSFKKGYANLSKGDKRRDVFCSPIILYICCVSQIDIFKHNSVASVYDEVFSVIGKKEYHAMTEETEKEFEINKQFTKELAFQMFLNGKLDDTLSSKWVDIAKEKTIKLKKERYEAEDIIPEFKKLFALNHFTFNKNDAVEFAHKTVCEYFTAVKFYEDFFEHILERSSEDAWRSIFSAFRYKVIPIDIMNHLVELIESKKNGEWVSGFFKVYYRGIEQQFLSSVAKEDSEYSKPDNTLLDQIFLTFRNFTWLLTGLGFDNSEFISTKRNLDILASYVKGDVNLNYWKNLEKMNLSMLDLTNAQLKWVYFEKAEFIGTCFKGANLTGVYLEGACLKDVNFENSCLDAGHFDGAQFVRVNFRSSSLVKAHLKSASFHYVSIYHVMPQGASLQKTVFEQSSIENVNFKESKLNGVRFKNVCLEHVNFERAELKKAIFVKADLSDSIFIDAKLGGSVFKQVNIKFANFERAILKGATLNGVCFEGVELKKTCFDFANLEGAHFENLNLTETHFISSKLRKAHFEGTKFKWVVFAQAHFENVHFENACFDNVFFDGILPRIYLLETDLPKFDNYIRNGMIVIVDPIVTIDDNRKVYNPETNRMEIKEE